MTTPERFEQQLQQQYQHSKAKHPMPAALIKTISGKAKQRPAGVMPGLWRNMQLALSVCGVVLLGVLLQRSPATATGYYHIVQLQDPLQQSQYKEVQRHSLVSQAEAGAVKQQQALHNYFSVKAKNDNFHYQTGLLRRQQQDWEISVCDELLLSIDHNLLAKIAVTSIDPTELHMGQWVEFVSNARGQLVAISAATQPLQCRQG